MGFVKAFDMIARLRAQRIGAVADVLSKPAPPAMPVTGSASSALAKLAQVPKTDKPATEADRILALPEWDPETFAIDLTGELKTLNGTWELKPLQSLALHWIREVRGLLGPLPVGSGKTLVSLLAPTVLKAERPVLMLPPQMVTPLMRMWDILRPHWKIQTNIHVVPYSQLSVASSTRLLEETLRPDLIVCDECHALRYETSARTKRVLRFAQMYPTTRFVFLSGTVTARGLRDYAHLAELALRGMTPLPKNADELISWSACLDADGKPRSVDWDMFARFHDVRHIDMGDDNGAARREAARAVFQRRLTRTPGVVSSTESSVGSSLILRRRAVEMPDIVKEALQNLRATWCRPDGEELVSALDYWRASMQLMQGFYYYWDWTYGGKKPGDVDKEWLNARARWHKVVRGILQQNIAGLDSPLLVYRATEKGLLQDPNTRGAYDGWLRVRDREKPPTKTQWLSEYLISDALDWMEDHPKGLVWQSDKAMERAFVDSGVKVIPAGETPPDDGKQGMVLSIPSHGTGLNLQAHNEALIVCFPGSGKTDEQLLGRLHRQGQLADEVTFDYYAESPEAAGAVAKAKADAKYIQDTMRAPQKLLYATWVGPEIGT